MTVGELEATWNRSRSEEPARTLRLRIVLALFLTAACLVNPLRECPIDDDWAYAETVRHFWETSRYRLNDWLSANILFPTVWAALFCGIGGYSFATLRVSTLVLALVGLAAFRGLALEHRLSRGAANLLTLCLASSPLVFKMSLTFMSDVPFLATMTAALLFYTRALRSDERGPRSWLLWLTASAAAAAAVLTRQFGVALLGGLAVVWLCDPRRVQRLADYCVGASLPAAAGIWQLHRGWSHPNWAAQFNLNRERIFLFGSSAASEPIPPVGSAFLKAFPWRPVVFVEYLAWFLMPLMFVAALGIFRGIRKRCAGEEVPAGRGIPSLVEIVAWGVLCVGGVFYGSRIVGHSDRMPFVPWNFEILTLLKKTQLVATVIAVGGGILFAPLLARRVGSPSARPRALHEKMLDATTLFLVLLLLVYVQIGDEYLLVLLPFAAIAVGQQLEGLLLAWQRPVIVLCLALLAGAAVWTREDLCRNEAIWKLAERQHAVGIRAARIFAGSEWAGYYQFDEYARQVPPTAHTTFADIFERWIPEMRRRADYWVVHDPTALPGEKWKTIDEARYFSVFSRGVETFYTIRRDQKAPRR